jgi:hypothetical protein
MVDTTLSHLKSCCSHDSECGVHYLLECNAVKSGENKQSMRHYLSEKSNVKYNYY